MKLWYSTTSPFVRQVRAVAHHHHLQDQIELLQTTKAFDPQSGQNQDNPLGKIPALQRDNGEWLYSSRLIAEYLDSLGHQAKLFPESEQRWSVLNLYALAEGILENTVAFMLPERMFRPETEWWKARHEQIIERNQRSLNVLATQLQAVGFELNIATLYMVCVIDFLNFRANVASTAEYSAMPVLNAWAKEMNQRYACLAETQPYQA